MRAVSEVADGVEDKPAHHHQYKTRKQERGRVAQLHLRHGSRGSCRNIGARTLDAFCFKLGYVRLFDGIYFCSVAVARLGLLYPKLRGLFLKAVAAVLALIARFVFGRGVTLAARGFSVVAGLASAVFFICIMFHVFTVFNG